MADEITLESDVPVVGAGRAGMFAAVAAERNGAALLCERMHRTHMAAAAESR
jgi:thioredoxin reductase